MHDNTVEDVVLTDEVQENVEPEPIPGPTPEEVEAWERERKAEWEAMIQPFRNLKTQVNEHDDLMADTLYELTLLELGMEE